MLPEAPGQRIAEIRQASLGIHAHRSMVSWKGISVGKLEPPVPVTRHECTLTGRDLER